MIPHGVRGNKRGWYQVQKTKMKFRELLSQFKSDKEFMYELGLKRRTFYRYKSIVRQEDRIIWQKIMHKGEFRRNNDQIGKT
jgi:hypothetical protein